VVARVAVMEVVMAAGVTVEARRGVLAHRRTRRTTRGRR